MTEKTFPWNTTAKRGFASLLFVILFLAVSWYYDYHDILTYKPQSIHKWRQSDCASITLNYYQHGMKFFQPEVHNLASDNRTTGYAVGECPVFYYLVAGLYKIFGHHDLIYRLVNSLLFFLGLFALYKILERWLDDSFWGISLTLLFFTSPVVVYYANNYLTDTTSFAFVLMGWHFFFSFYFTRKYRFFYVSFLFFTIAGLLKVTSAINGIALLGLYLTHSFGWPGLKKSDNRLSFRSGIVLPFIGYFLVIISWYLFAIHYNHLHQTEFFSTRIWPIWDLSKETILWIREQMRALWFRDYFHITVHLLLMVCFVAVLVLWKKIHPLLLTLTLLFFAGVVLFSVLWFYAFGNHDYYIIGLLIFPVFIFLSLAHFLTQRYPGIMKSVTTKVLFALFLLFNIYYAGQRLEWRYNGWINDYPENKDLYEVTPYLRSLGIRPEDKVISLPDPTPCFSLYLMNQRGWTEHYRNNTDSLKIEESIALGAKYLILNGGEVTQRPYLQHFMQNKRGQFGTVSIYSLMQ